MSVRLANIQGRAQLVIDDRCIDVATRSSGRFGPNPMDLLADWESFRNWAEGVELRNDGQPYRPESLSPPVPHPSQVFAIGLNYKDHAGEANLQAPAQPMVFTKFPSCLAGPVTSVKLTSNRVDWEVELVVVIGRGGSGITEATALEHVAGYTIGQDISDRRRQFGDAPPQFSLGKSLPGFGPTGPLLVSLDALDDQNALTLTCDINGERMQDGTTADMIFNVPQLVAYLSDYCELRPGDLIFTGTPSGVGSVRKPPQYLVAGDRIVSEIEGLGQLDNLCV